MIVRPKSDPDTTLTAVQFVGPITRDGARYAPGSWVVVWPNYRSIYTDAEFCECFWRVLAMAPTEVMVIAIEPVGAS